MKEKIINIVSNKNVLMAIVFIAVVLISLQSINSGYNIDNETGIKYRRYNNYAIFQNSFYHLLNKQDLYVLYEKEAWDLYKYPPTFAAFFGAFAVLPDWAGLTLWNLLNAFVLLLSIYYLPKLSNYEKGIVSAIILVELITSIQNQQSNGLIAGLLVFSFGFLENKRYLLATLFIVLSVYIKLFGVVGMALFLFYPQKWKLVLTTAMWFVILFFIPLIFIDINQYFTMLGSYANLLTADHIGGYGYSVMGWIDSWFGLHLNKNIVVLFGAIIFLIPTINIKNYKFFNFRMITLASILIWVVIFNHKAESPTYIIAVTGVALWFISSEKSLTNIILLILVILFTVLSPTDLFPRYIRDTYVETYNLKAFPCIIIWGKLIYDLIIFNETTIDKE